MNKFLWLNLFLFLFHTASAASFDITGFYKGTVGKESVQVTLKQKGQEITGQYFYEKDSKVGISDWREIQLAGTINPQGELKLTETEIISDGKREKKYETGIFKGKVDSGKISGRWQNPKSTQEYPFRLEKSPDKIDYDFSGTYGWGDCGKNDDEPCCDDTIEVHPLGKHKVSFDFTTTCGTPKLGNAREKEIKGIAELKGNGFYYRADKHFTLRVYFLKQGMVKLNGLNFK